MFIRFACWNALALTLTIIILVGFLPFGIQTTAINNQALLEIYVIDVGQGDSTLIISPTNITMLIDGGNDGCGNNTILPLLNTLGITSLNYIVVTHYHEDHIGGLDEVINAIGITDYVYDRGYSYTTPAYQDYVKAASNKRKTITDGEIIDLGGGAIAKCVSVNGNGVVDPTTASENDLCIALVITFGYFDYFTGGDLSGEDVLEYNYHDIESSVAKEVGNVEVYKVNHHGSSHSTNPYFIAIIKPEVSIISVGDNEYGHPTQTVLDRLVAANCYIYLTEEGSGGRVSKNKGVIVNGNIVIKTDGGKSYTVNNDYYLVDEIKQEPITIPYWATYAGVAGTLVATYVILTRKYFK